MDAFSSFPYFKVFPCFPYIFTLRHLLSDAVRAPTSPTVILCRGSPLPLSLPRIRRTAVKAELQEAVRQRELATTLQQQQEQKAVLEASRVSEGVGSGTH